MTGPVTLLAFDVGARRIGVALGNTLSGTARELGVLDVREAGPDWPRLDQWCKEWRPDALVVGDPATLDGGDQPARQRARAFARDIARRYGLPVHAVDERSSSVEAARRFAAGRAAGTRKRHQAEQIDALAAVIILERWLADPGSHLPPMPEHP